MRVILTLVLVLYAPFQLSAQGFQIQHVASDKSITDVFMVNSTIGYAGSIDGVHKTSDGGQSWTLLPFFLPTGDFSKDYYTLNFNEVHLHFFDELNGIAYGWHSFNYEIIMRTTDGGLTWGVKHFQYPESINYNFNILKSLHVWDDANMIIAGYGGRILRTSDGGENWTGIRVSSVEPDMRKIQFVSGNLGYVAGDSKFYTSTDGGDNWSERSLGFNIYDFHFFDALHGIALGESGYFFETADGGKKWTSGLMQAEDLLTHLKFANNTVGYAMGVSGHIYKTNNAGKSWLKIYMDGNEISSSSLLSPDLIWFSVQKGYILHSTNGGAFVAPPPMFGSISPINGSIGSTVSISGTNLSSVVGVNFNHVAASYKITGESLVAKIPRGAETGKIELVWSNGSVFSGSDFVISNAPLLYQPIPNAVPRGVQTILQGDNLQHITKLTLGNFEFAYSLLSSMAISLKIPDDYPLAPQTLTVYSPFGNASLQLTLSDRPEVTNLATDVAPWRIVTITGNDLILTTEVMFGNIPAASFTVLDNKTITCVVPAVNAKYICSVTVTTPSGQGSSIGKFTIHPASEIIGVSPTTIKVGEELKIEGNNLPDGLFGRIWIGGVEVYSSDVRKIDGHTMFVKMPEIIGGLETPFTITNEGGLSITQKFSINVTGRLANHISYVNPIRVKPSGLVIIKGTFLSVDSITVNGLKHSLHNSRPNYVSFIVNDKTTSGFITLFDNGEPFSYEDELVVSDYNSPIFDFFPKEATIGTKVSILSGNIRYINSIQVNGRYVPFSPSLNYYDTGVSFIVTDSLTSGPVRVNTIDGSYQSPDWLGLQAPSDGKPIIYSYLDGVQPQSFMIKLIGHNFLNTTAVRFDQFNVDFVIQDDDTLLVNYPENVSSIYFSTNQVIVESLNGNASLWLPQTFYPTQTIKSATPTIAKRGSIITLTLTQKKPYIPFPNYYNFLFGNTIIDASPHRINDTTYQVTVPLNGDVEGKIGIANGRVYYSNIKFTLADQASGYCTAAGIGIPDIRALKKIMIQGNVHQMSNHPYVDKTDEPVEVLPGQSLRLGITPSWIIQQTKIFFDWNSDGEFNEAGILMTSGSPPQLDSMLYTIVTVPLTTQIGKAVRLRVVTTNNVDTVLPCGIQAGGQVVDYQLNIVAPSTTLKVFDFFPRIGKVGTKVTVVGNYLNALQDVTLNGISMEFGISTDHTAELIIPEGATHNNLVFRTANQTVTTSQQFNIDETIMPPDAVAMNFNYTYRVTLNGKDLPYHYFFNEFAGTNGIFEVHDAKEFPENGLYCLYTPGGELCSIEPLLFEPFIDFPDPFLVRAGQALILTGRNLSGITSIKLDGEVEVPFTVLDEYSISIIPPPSDWDTRIINLTSAWNTITHAIDYEIEIPKCDQYSGWNEGAEIISLKFNQIDNSSTKNISGGRSDYSAQFAITDLYNSYYTNAVVKNFSNEQKYVTISVIINGTDTLGREYLAYKAGGSEGIILQPNEEATLHPYFALPNNVPLNQSMGCWFVLHYYFWNDECESVIGEIEKYSLFIKQNHTIPSLSILSLSTETAKSDDHIIVTGTNLHQVKSLQIGDLFTQFSIVSPTSIQFTVPNQATTGYVKVMSLNNEALSSTPLKIIQPHTISSIEPPFGKAGDVVIVKGTNLNRVTTILFYDNVNSNFIINSSSEIRLIVPPSAKTGSIQFNNIFNQAVSSEAFYLCDGINPNAFCKVNQQITFPNLEYAIYGQASISLTATASSSLPISFFSSDNSVATVSGNTLIITGSGSANISAIQPGNSFFYPAAEVVRVLSVGKSVQSISFSFIADVLLSELPVVLQGISTSHLPVTFTSENAVTIIENILSSQTTGRITVNASQNGNNNFEAAASVDRSFCIIPLKPTIFLTEISDGNLTITSSSDNGNQWFLNDLKIEGVESQTIQVEKAGSYKVRVVVDDCSGELSDAVEVVITGMEEQSQQIVYPNPAKDKMYIRSNQNFTEVRITNMVGKNVLMIPSNILENQAWIDLDELPHGLYILELLENVNIVHRQKFIKE
jgi:photosystem II stability/assembly factor-like uncharacterized protein